MRREYPVFYATTSRYVVTPLSVMLLIAFVVTYFDTKSVAILYPVCITAFGITVAMARLCFSFRPQVRERQINSQLLYAGEKFSLASLLILQMLFIVFGRDFLTNAGVLRIGTWWTTLIYRILGALWVLVGTSAVWSWHWAYCAFHDELWANWKKRIAAINIDKT